MAGARQAAGGLSGVREPAPDLHRVPARRPGPTGAGRLLRGHLDGGREAPGRVPDAQPAVAVAARAPDRGVRAAADDERDPRRRGSDERVVQVEEPPVEGDRLAGQERAQHGQAFVHPRAPGGRVHPADRDLVPVLAADAHPEGQPPGREPLDVRELPGHQDWMAQRQQVQAARDPQRGVQRGQRRGLQEPVEAQAHEEAHVVGAADMINPCRGDLVQEGPGRDRIPVQQIGRREHADPGGDGVHDRRRRGPGMSAGTLAR